MRWDSMSVCFEWNIKRVCYLSRQLSTSATKQKPPFSHTHLHTSIDVEHKKEASLKEIGLLVRLRIQLSDDSLSLSRVTSNKWPACAPEPRSSGKPVKSVGQNWLCERIGNVQTDRPLVARFVSYGGRSNFSSISSCYLVFLIKRCVISNRRMTASFGQISPR